MKTRSITFNVILFLVLYVEAAPKSEEIPQNEESEQIVKDDAKIIRLSIHQGQKEDGSERHRSFDNPFSEYNMINAIKSSAMLMNQFGGKYTIKYNVPESEQKVAHVISKITDYSSSEDGDILNAANGERRKVLKSVKRVKPKDSQNSDEEDSKIIRISTLPVEQNEDVIETTTQNDHFVSVEVLNVQNENNPQTLHKWSFQSKNITLNNTIVLGSYKNGSEGDATGQFGKTSQSNYKNNFDFTNKIGKDSFTSATPHSDESNHPKIDNDIIKSNNKDLFYKQQNNDDLNNVKKKTYQNSNENSSNNNAENESKNSDKVVNGNVGLSTSTLKHRGSLKYVVEGEEDSGSQENYPDFAQFRKRVEEVNAHKFASHKVPEIPVHQKSENLASILKRLLTLMAAKNASILANNASIENAEHKEKSNLNTHLHSNANGQSDAIKTLENNYNQTSKILNANYKEKLATAQNHNKFIHSTTGRISIADSLVENSNILTTVASKEKNDKYNYATTTVSPLLHLYFTTQKPNTDPKSNKVESRPYQNTNLKLSASLKTTKDSQSSDEEDHEEYTTNNSHDEVKNVISTTESSRKIVSALNRYTAFSTKNFNKDEDKKYYTSTTEYVSPLVPLYFNTQKPETDSKLNKVEIRPYQSTNLKLSTSLKTADDLQSSDENYPEEYKTTNSYNKVKNYIFTTESSRKIVATPYRNTAFSTKTFEDKKNDINVQEPIINLKLSSSLKINKDLESSDEEVQKEYTTIGLHNIISTTESSRNIVATLHRNTVFSTKTFNKDEAKTNDTQTAIRSSNNGRIKSTNTFANRQNLFTTRRSKIPVANRRDNDENESNDSVVTTENSSKVHSSNNVGQSQIKQDVRIRKPTYAQTENTNDAPKKSNNVTTTRGKVRYNPSKYETFSPFFTDSNLRGIYEKSEINALSKTNPELSLDRGNSRYTNFVSEKKSDNDTDEDQTNHFGNGQRNRYDSSPIRFDLTPNRNTIRTKLNAKLSDTDRDDESQNYATRRPISTYRPSTNLNAYVNRKTSFKPNDPSKSINTQRGNVTNNSTDASVESNLFKTTKDTESSTIKVIGYGRSTEKSSQSENIETRNFEGKVTNSSGGLSNRENDLQNNFKGKFTRIKVNKINHNEDTINRSSQTRLPSLSSSFKVQDDINDKLNSNVNINSTGQNYSVRSNIRNSGGSAIKQGSGFYGGSKSIERFGSSKNFSTSGDQNNSTRSNVETSGNTFIKQESGLFGGLKKFGETNFKENVQDKYANDQKYLSKNNTITETSKSGLESSNVASKEFKSDFNLVKPSINRTQNETKTSGLSITNSGSLNTNLDNNSENTKYNKRPTYVSNQNKSIYKSNLETGTNETKLTTKTDIGLQDKQSDVNLDIKSKISVNDSNDNVKLTSGNLGSQKSTGSDISLTQGRFSLNSNLKTSSRNEKDDSTKIKDISIDSIGENSTSVSKNDLASSENTHRLAQGRFSSSRSNLNLDTSINLRPKPLSYKEKNDNNRQEEINIKLSTKSSSTESDSNNDDINVNQQRTSKKFDNLLSGSKNYQNSIHKGEYKPIRNDANQYRGSIKFKLDEYDWMFEGSNESPSEFGFKYDIPNGISAYQKGVLTKVEDRKIYVINGSYQYMTDDGYPITVYYTADQNGFHPKIVSHILTSDGEAKAPPKVLKKEQNVETLKEDEIYLDEYDSEELDR